MSEKIRSFIAFDVDSDQVLRKFSEAQGLLADTGADLKLVQPRNIHITMRFLGNIPPTMVDSIHDALKQISFSPFEIELRGLGVFPNLRRPRVVWAGIQKGADELTQIINQLEPHLRRLGFKSDKKGFRPHLTLARVRSGRHKAELAQRIDNLAEYSFGSLTADYLRLKQSVLTPQGPIYTVLREIEALRS